MSRLFTSYYFFHLKLPNVIFQREIPDFNTYFLKSGDLVMLCGDFEVIADIEVAIISRKGNVNEEFFLIDTDLITGMANIWVNPAEGGKKGFEFSVRAEYLKTYCEN